MSKNILVISCEIRETRVALIEGGIIAELHIERRGKVDSHTVGNVVLGKVTRVLPGLQAAFIDIGQERAAFLHVEDLIRPDDFETYLAGGHKRTKEATERPEVTGNEELDTEAEETLEISAPLLPAAPAEASAVEGDAPDGALDLGRPSDADVVIGLRDDEDDEDDAAPVDSELDDEDDDEGRASRPSDESLARVSDVALADDAEELDENAPTMALERDSFPEFSQAVDAAEGRESGDPEFFDPEASAEYEVAHVAIASEHADVEGTAVAIEEGERASDAPGTEADWDAPTPAGALELRAPNARRRGDGLPGMPGFTISDPNEAEGGTTAARAPNPARAGGGGGGRGQQGRRSRSRRGRERDTRDRSRESSGGRDGGHGRSRGERGNAPNRISKSTPIREVVREGQEIIVQVTKDPIGTKGARCSSHVSLPGRYVVYLPTVDHIGISKRIGSEKERSRLRDAIESMKPPSGGLIVRTVAEGLTKKQLKQDVGYLVRLWGEIAKKREGARSPTVLMSELDLVLKTARDLFTDEVHQIVIDDRHQYERLCRFVEMFAPDRLKDIVYYSGDEPIFDAYGIEDEIGRALSRKVPLPSGGYLIIDQAEALTAIDVNTGRFVGKGPKDIVETILKTNLEAVHEIAYQLRFRNIGGLIILDLIDMERHQNREKVRRKLEELLQKDKAKTTLNRISDLGLIEMTRKRTRESLGRLMHEPCFYCDGTGQLQSKETIAYEILREIRRKRSDLPGYTVLVNAHPAVADVLTTSEKDAVTEAENRYMRKIQVVPRKEYHLEQFDLQGK